MFKKKEERPQKHCLWSINIKQQQQPDSTFCLRVLNFTANNIILIIKKEITFQYFNEAI